MIRGSADGMNTCKVGSAVPDVKLLGASAMWIDEFPTEDKLLTSPNMLTPPDTTQYFSCVARDNHI